MNTQQMVFLTTNQQQEDALSDSQLRTKNKIRATERVEVSTGNHHPGRRNPRVGCAGIVRRGEAILLGKRDKEPGRGLWVLPGGGVEFGETFVETLQRELLEETGIEIDVEGVFNVCELINPPTEHRVIVYLNARYRSGQPAASSDLSDARFFDIDELKQMSTSKMISPFVESVLRKAEVL
ncbi:MAG TPA: NUDIX hydrolase [Chthoniobacterales bacterium]|jgi:8-oxo-dGTP diphosphatase|nr:NUDIX hydrolase [Chthoniobacterales bacterium]